MIPRLRASCDQCRSAKVKCVKTDTGCQRCDSSAGELACKFGPVLPRIYHKKGSPRNRGGCSQTSQPVPPAEPSLLDDFYGSNGISQAGLGQVVYLPAAAPGPTLDQQLYGIDVDAEPNCFFQQYAPPSSMQMPQNSNLWLGGIGARSPTSTTPGLTDAATPTDAASSTSLLPSTNRSQATPNHHVNHRPSASSSSEPIFTPTPCDCFTHLLKAMQNVNSHATTHNPKLDVVLCANRTAAKLCLTGLRCSQSSRTIAHDRSSSCWTIACGLLDRILISYQAALEHFGAQLDDEREKRGEEGEDDEDERATRQTTSVEWRLGTFALEPSEQVLWARKVVAREAGKIQETLAGFEGQDGSVRSVLLAHLLERYKSVIDQISGS